MLPPDTICALAKRLYEARKNRIQLRHFSAEHPEMTIQDGYAIQREWVKLELADGASADDMRMKLLFDLAYVIGLEKVSTFIVVEFWIIVKTPWVMARGLGR